MSVSATVTREIDVNGTKTRKEETVTAGRAQRLYESIPDLSTDLLVAFTNDVSAAKWIYLTADQALTIKTNNSGAPTDTIVLSAGETKLWTDSDAAAARPFSADVTALYVSNASGAAANLVIETGEDPTP